MKWLVRDISETHVLVYFQHQDMLISNTDQLIIKSVHYFLMHNAAHALKYPAIQYNLTYLAPE